MLSTMQDESLSLATLLRYASTAHADSTVSTWTGTESRVMTYGEVGRQAAKLAHALRALGIDVGDRVATFMWNNNEHLVAYAGVPAMGAVLHTLNIRLFPEQLVFVANHAEDRVVIVDGSLVPLLAAQLPHLKTVRHVIVANGDGAALDAPEGIEVHSYDALLADQPDTYAYPEIDERSAAAMCYTSGTTGDPKGVVYSHRSNWLHAMQACSGNGMGLAAADTVLAIVPMFHANAWGIPYAALMSGASVLMPDRFLQPEPLLAFMAAERPTFAGAVPTIWNGVLGALEAKPQDITHLREVVVGGSAVPPSLMRAFEDKHGVRILHAWGMTETSPLGSVARPPAGTTGEEAFAYRITQGQFPAAVRARLVDDSGAVLPHDGRAVGELQVRGPWITGAYYGPDGAVVDADKFQDGWLRTGDVGHISPDGYLTLVDRSKDIIKSGGEWISSVDLENAVMGHPDIVEAAVFGIPDAKWDERPVVAAVLRDGATVAPAALREFLTGKVAKWQLPEHWTFIPEVPKTSVGKFDKKALRAQFADGGLEITTLG
ncbi:MAG: long-chain-fatty-acid--CoA ligase [Nocardia sp.]|uniref:long-chain fatty acid--CoA ligase n=1 Tax=Nocardia sp. TaxID=1821 RepID=UPI0026051ABF|nr:long-chain fatty acid--CoA ligase [Nocardia sp.]MCU1644205.1 long-chain-fatty-acid--CoA ligase [Nocardia sp.]